MMMFTPCLALADPTVPIAKQQPATVDSQMPALAFYVDGVRHIQSHDNSGVVDLRKAANLGYVPAELYLAKLYEDGRDGVVKDLTEARPLDPARARRGRRP